MLGADCSAGRMKVHRDGIADWHDDRGRFALARADRTKHIGRDEAEILAAAGRPPVWPHTRVRVFFGDPLLGEKPHLDSRSATGAARTALIASPELRNAPHRRVGRDARPRHQPAQLHPMQQPIGGRQAALDIELLLQDALRVDPAKRHHPIPRQVGAGNDPLLQTHRRRPIHKRLPAGRGQSRSPSIPSSHNGYAIIGRGSAEPAKRSVSCGSIPSSRLAIIRTR